MTASTDFLTTSNASHTGESVGESIITSSGLYYYYHDFWQETSHPVTGQLPLVYGGPWKLFSILWLYYMFVKHWGPSWMKDRKAFDLKWWMLTHNVFLILLNGICFILSLPYSRFGLSTWECRPYDHTKQEFKEHLLMFFGYVYYVSKFLDLADTIFFVLRKKNRNISNLHVFHHSVMPFAGWVGLKFSAYHCAGFIPFVNAFIHTIMYIYYALAALGRHEVLWWKKYLTQMQMIQFVLIFMHAIYFLTNSTCSWPKIFPALEACHGLLFFYLFYSFYRRNYSSTSSSSVSASASLSLLSTTAAAGKNNNSLTKSPQQQQQQNESSSSCVKAKVS